MSAPASHLTGGKTRTAAKDPVWLQVLLITVSISFVILFLVLPLAVIFIEALRHGLGMYLRSFNDSAAMHAIKLTLIATGIALPLNLVFGVAAAWAIAKFEFKGKSL